MALDSSENRIRSKINVAVTWKEQTRLYAVIKIAMSIEETEKRLVARGNDKLNKLIQTLYAADIARPVKRKKHPADLTHRRVHHSEIKNKN